jgi:hypothetical protein
MNIKWDRFGAKLGIGVCVAGFVLIFFGWNGAASVDRLQSQFPYLISGGLAGLALVVLGAALILVETSRDERDGLRDEVAELRKTIEAAFPAARKEADAEGRGEFVAGTTSYHRPTCRLLEGRGELPRVTAADAAARRLVPCRVCEPSTATPRTSGGQQGLPGPRRRPAARRRP